MRRVLLLIALIIGVQVHAELQNVEVGGDIKIRNAAQGPIDLGAYYQAESEKHYAARRMRVEALATPEEIAAYQQEKRDYFVEALGGFPERTPLNARVVGEGHGDDYRYEKIIYESQPGFFVTAVLFLPHGDGPFPGVLVPCGHSNNGKAAETYQRASILLAKNGMAALCYDPIGQGERYHFLKEDGKPEFGTTIHHTLMGVGAILTGTNVAMYRIWDGMRGLDYLESRDDIDPERLACTGNSGGGTLTSYIMALDPRVSVAAASCYLTSFDKLLTTIGPQDAEQDIYGQIANGLEHTEYIHLRAPKPTLICAATHDFFDIEGTWDTFREAKQLYTKLGYPERVDLAEANEKHGFSKPLRQAMVQWMRRWLIDVDEPIVEPDFPIHSDEEMLCTPDGQVLNLEGARSLFDLNIARSGALAAGRESLWNELSPEELRDKIADRMNFSRPAQTKRAEKAQPDSASPRVEIHVPGTFKDDELHNIDITVKYYLPPEVGDFFQNTLFNRVPDAGFESEPGTGLTIWQASMSGEERLWPKDNNHGWESTVGAHWQSFFRAYLMGETQLAHWTKDISAAMNATRGLFDELGLNDTLITVHAKGWTTIPALHAFALNPGAGDKLILEGGIPSWSEVVATPRAKGQLMTAVHGALELYDLPDLVKLCPEGSVEVRNPAIPTF